MRDLANTFNSALEGFLALVKKYGYVNILTSLFIMGVSLYTIININKIDSIVSRAIETSAKNNVKSHDENMILRHNVNGKIEEHLTSVLMKTGADRIIVLEMHNGVNNINGLPFVYVNVTYSKYLDGVISIDSDYVNLNMSRFYFFSHALKSNTWGGTANDVKAFDNKFYGRMISHGVNYVYITTLHNERHPFGFIILAYGEGTEVIDKDKIENIMNIYTQKISSLLTPIFKEDNVAEE